PEAQRARFKGQIPSEATREISVISAKASSVKKKSKLLDATTRNDWIQSHVHHVAPQPCKRGAADTWASTSSPIWTGNPTRCSWCGMRPIACAPNASSLFFLSCSEKREQEPTSPTPMPTKSLNLKSSWQHRTNAVHVFVRASVIQEYDFRVSVS